MAEIVCLNSFRQGNAVLTLEERIAALILLLPLLPEVEDEILRLRNEIWLIETG